MKRLFLSLTIFVFTLPTFAIETPRLNNEAAREHVGLQSTEMKCKNCSRSVPSIESLKGVASAVNDKFSGQILDTPPPTDMPDCGPLGKPNIIKLKNIEVSLELNFDPVSKWVDAVGPNGKKIRVRRYVKNWHCALTLPKGCGTAAKNNTEALAAAADIANFFNNGKYSDTNYCTQSLELFYEQCSPWNLKDRDERIRSVFKLTKEAVSSLKKTKGDDFQSDLVSPELLTCIAKRESHDLEPMRLNYTACRSRVNPERLPPKIRDLVGGWFMASWRSDAGGLVQHRYDSLADHWKRYMKKEVSTIDPVKTMEQVYGDPETLFKKMFSDPKLQLEIMARHLNHLVQNLRRAEVKDPFTRAIAKYDADQADTYIPNVKKCVACLKGNPNNLDCLKGLHEKSKLKKVVKRKRKK